MKHLIFFAADVLCFAACMQTADTSSLQDYPVRQVNLTQVELTDAFWLPRIQTVQTKTIRYAFGKCDSEGRFENFRTAARVMKGEKGKVRGAMPFDDTDVYKTIEGAAYSLVSAPDPDLEHYVDSIISIIALGQEADGYLTTWRTIDPMNPPADWVEPGERWTGLEMSHELYNSGHLFEAAAAHYRATGKRNFLNIALRNADLLVKVFGDTAKYEVPGHEIVETGLIKLYHITRNEDYLNLSRKFLDLRGDSTRRELRGPYSQDHLPLTQQKEVTGHAVRAVYLYAGMTDIAAICGDTAYRKAIHTLWENMTEKKMYLTGGLGALRAGEAFGSNYELPNLTAYSETCAAIGGVYWDERMFRLTRHSRYYDVLERTLYNALIAGISLNGTEFFYPNPLEADGHYGFNQGKRTRQPWFDCSCCPTNLIRFIPYIPGLIYATQADTAVYVNLFIAGKANIPLGANTVHIVQETAYPLEGKVSLRITADKPVGNLALRIRIPGWALNEVSPGSLYEYANAPADEPCTLHLNGAEVQAERRNGYVEISGGWTGSDLVELTLPMKVRLVKAHEQVDANRGLLALEYGLLVYCAEEADNSRFSDITLSAQTPYTVEQKPGLLGGIQVIQGGGATFIPYYAWSNRGEGKMKVWFNTSPL
jgi:DUF1680 family protein